MGPNQSLRGKRKGKTSHVLPDPPYLKLSKKKALFPFLSKAAYIFLNSFASRPVADHAIKALMESIPTFLPSFFPPRPTSPPFRKTYAFPNYFPIFCNREREFVHGMIGYIYMSLSIYEQVCQSQKPSSTPTAPLTCTKDAH